MVADELEPPFDDGYGYRVRKRDLQFLGIDEYSFLAFRSGLHPLGCDRKEWIQFTTTLELALTSDWISDADIRLQGSSANFFAGHHKEMPYAAPDIVQAFMTARGRVPSKFELERIMEKLAGVWPEGGKRPRRRPFDSLHRLRVERYPSDIDVQISSDEIVDRARARIDELGLPRSELFVVNEKYAFVQKFLVTKACPHLTAWAIEQSDVLARPVTIAVFPSSGPPRIPGKLSSHFKKKDWLVTLSADS